jgi:hypothetical protein
MPPSAQDKEKERQALRGRITLIKERIEVYTSRRDYWQPKYEARSRANRMLRAEGQKISRERQRAEDDATTEYQMAAREVETWEAKLEHAEEKLAALS